MAKPKVTFNIPLAQKVAMDAAKRGVRAATLEGERIVQVDILSSFPPRTGREYPRGKDRVHIASAPGEAPAPDKGQLRAMTSVEFHHSETVAHGQIVNNLDKAAPLQLGTDKIAPRPWLSRLLTGEFVGRIRAAFYRASRL